MFLAMLIIGNVCAFGYRQASDVRRQIEDCLVRVKLCEGWAILFKRKTTYLFSEMHVRPLFA